MRSIALVASIVLSGTLSTITFASTALAVTIVQWTGENSFNYADPSLLEDKNKTWPSEAPKISDAPVYVSGIKLPSTPTDKKDEKDHGRGREKDVRNEVPKQSASIAVGDSCKPRGLCVCRRRRHC